MAIYETTMSSTRTSFTQSSSATLVLKAIMALVFAGPLQLIPNVGRRDRNMYARGSNEKEDWSSTLQATVSLTLWCLGLIFAVTGKGKYLTSSKTKASRRTAASSVREEEPIAEAARVVAAFCRRLVMRAHQKCTKRSDEGAQTPADGGGGDDDFDDVTITEHSGSCQCGAVQFQFKAPRTLYVEQEPQSDDADAGKIQYPKTCIPVNDFVLTSGAKNLKSFQRAGAHTFCAACGVHVMHALQPDSTELFVNVRCLKRGTFSYVATPSREKNKSKAKNKEPGNMAASPSSSGLVDIVPPSLPAAEHHDDEPLFTVTAASSISKSFSSAETTDYGDDRSSTAELEQAAYRLRKALTASDSTTGRFVPQTDSEEESSSESFVALGPETPPTQVRSTTVAASAIRSPTTGNPDVMIGSFTEVQSPAAASKVNDDGNNENVDDEDDKKPMASATAPTASTSFQESVSSSVPSTEVSREQLRRFMNKHVDPANKTTLARK